VQVVGPVHALLGLDEQLLALRIVEPEDASDGRDHLPALVVGHVVVGAQDFHEQRGHGKIARLSARRFVLLGSSAEVAGDPGLEVAHA